MFATKVSHVFTNHHTMSELTSEPGEAPPDYDDTGVVAEPPIKDYKEILYIMYSDGTRSNRIDRSDDKSVEILLEMRANMLALLSDILQTGWAT